MFLIRHWLLMVLPFALWGTSMTAMAPLVVSGGPELVAFLRLFPAGLILLCSVGFLGRSFTIASEDWFWFLCFTLVDATLFQFFLARGLSETGAGLGSVLIDSQPLLVALFARSLFGEAINPIGWLGLMIGLVGIICLGAPPDFLKHWVLLGKSVNTTSLLNNGEAWMLAAALAMALGTVLIRYACRRSDPVAVTGWHMLLGSLPLIALDGIDRGWFVLPPWSTLDWVLMGYATVFGSAIAYGLFFWFANREELTSFTTLAFLTPVFALVTGGIWLGERLEPLQWLGVFLALSSVYLVSQRRRLWEPKWAESDSPADI